MQVQSLGWEDPLEESMASHFSVLAWRIPWTEEPGSLHFIGLQRVRYNWNDLACTHLRTMASGFEEVLIVQFTEWIPGSVAQYGKKDAPFITHSYPVWAQLQLKSHVCKNTHASDQIRSVAQSCPTLCDPMNRSMPGLPVHHQLAEFTQTHVHRVSDVIQPSHPLSSPSPAPNPSQHQGLFQWINSSHEVAKVLEFQL